MSGLAQAWAICRNELALALAEPLATILSMLVPLNFLVLFILFAVGGGRVPVAVVRSDTGVYGQAMGRSLNGALTFDLHPVASAAAGRALIARQDAVAVIAVPPGFSRAVAAGGTASLRLTLDNLNQDFADDVRRALPLAILNFYQYHQPAQPAHLPRALPVTWREIDTYPRTVGFLPYLAVSILTVATLLGGLLLGGRGVAGEWERGTIKELLLSPTPGWAVAAGKISAGFLIGIVSVLVVLGVLLAIGVRPDTWAGLPGVAAVLCVTLLVFLSLGVAAGSLLRRLNAVAPLAFGLGLPLFFISGAFGPIAWGGEAAAAVARLFPVAYADAAFQHAFHGYWPLVGGAPLVWGVLLLWAVAAVACSVWVYERSTSAH